MKYPVSIPYQSAVTCVCLAMAVLFSMSCMPLYAQCPANIGFETGGFANWTCDSSTVFRQKKLFTVPGLAPVPNRHTIIPNDGFGRKDPYGGFPVSCPNGSGYSIRLGDNLAGFTDAISYTVTVPADKNVYSIIYNYALVLQNPRHTTQNQPRFTARVFDVATEQYLECSSFEFAADSTLPGFKKAAGTWQGADIFYKPWSPVTVKLLGYAGKQLRIEFVMRDCGEGGHFGYAYLDINEDCSSPIGGNIVCAGTGSATLAGPFGFSEYRWYNADFSRQLGTGATLTVSPSPAASTQFALEVRPFPGSGCVDTLYTTIELSPEPFRFSVKDTIGVCLPATVDLTASVVTAGSSTGLQFSYFTDTSPAEYLSIPKLTDKTGNYIIKAVNSVGCMDMKAVAVIIDTIPVLTVTELPVTYFPNTVDITDPLLVSGHIAGLVYSYWKDAAATAVLSNPAAVDTGGMYYIEARTKYGCRVVLPVTVTIQIAPPPNIFSPNNDGINDTWVIRGLLNYPDCRIAVYNRDGRLVFHSVGYNKAWDGRMNDQPLPIGTYYYVIRVSDRLSPVSGSVTLVR